MKKTLEDSFKSNIQFKFLGILALNFSKINFIEVRNYFDETKGFTIYCKSLNYNPSATYDNKLLGMLLYTFKIIGTWVFQL